MRKKILTLLVVIIAFTTSTLSQTTFSIQGGYSLTMGIVGAEYQIGHHAIGAGYMPTKIPYTKQSTSSFSAYYSWRKYTTNENGHYLSIGFASTGYPLSLNYDSFESEWDGSNINPMGVLNFGYRFKIYSDLNLKTEIGYAWCENFQTIVCGIAIGWVFGI